DDACGGCARATAKGRDVRHHLLRSDDAAGDGHGALCAHLQRLPRARTACGVSNRRRVYASSARFLVNGDKPNAGKTNRSSRPPGAGERASEAAVDPTATLILSLTRDASRAAHDSPPAAEPSSSSLGLLPPSHARSLQRVHHPIASSAHNGTSLTLCRSS